MQNNLWRQKDKEDWETVVAGFEPGPLRGAVSVQPLIKWGFLTGVRIRVYNPRTRGGPGGQPAKGPRGS